MSPPRSFTPSLEATAPGKVVLCGEYAVLHGAPALVMAVDRRVRGVISAVAGTDQSWRFDALGFEGASAHNWQALAQPHALGADDPARLWAYTLQALGIDEMTAGGPRSCLIDTSAMYSEAGRKLGLGSSAAATVVCCGLLLGKGPTPTFQQAQAAHSASQGGVGSGLDIATSLHGGMIRFQAGSVEPRAWPETLFYRFVDTGVAASTPPLIRRFESWRKGDIPVALGNLIDAATILADEALNLDNLRRYAAALSSMDQAAGIGIYSAEHRDCQRVAEASGVVYKPCGAGGGDLGIAISDEPDQLDRFARGIAGNYATLDLGIAQHGLIIR